MRKVTREPYRRPTNRPAHRSRGDFYPGHRCECDHLRWHHGPDDHPASRDGCWWCACEAFVLYQPEQWPMELIPDDPWAGAS